MQRLSRSPSKGQRERWRPEYRAYAEGFARCVDIAISTGKNDVALLDTLIKNGQHRISASSDGRRTRTREERIEQWLGDFAQRFDEDDARVLLSDNFHLDGDELEAALAQRRAIAAERLGPQRFAEGRS
jgi:hypothetical protein